MIGHFPTGVGAKIQGHYNAKLGTASGNLHYEEVDPCTLNVIVLSNRDIK
jgi:hypothetical protein